MNEKPKEELKKEEVKKEELPKTVTIPTKFLESLKEEIAGLKKNQNLLMSVVDKKRVARYVSRFKGKEPNIVKLRELDGKVVISWKSTKDVVMKVGPQKWLEDQKTELTFEDRSTKEMPQRDFELRHQKIPCKRVGIITDEETGKAKFKLVRLDNGEECIIGAEFVN